MKSILVTLGVIVLCIVQPELAIPAVLASVLFAFNKILKHI